MATTRTPSGGDERIDSALQQLTNLTAAVERLATNVPPAVARSDSELESERRRARVAFVYEAMGTLMGRDGSTPEEFAVPAVVANRTSGGGITFGELPSDATWAELRAGRKVELLEIHNSQVSPTAITSSEAIRSLLILRTKNGPPVALGPRLAPVASSTRRS